MPAYPLRQPADRDPGLERAATALTDLDLSGNQLTAVPDSIGQLTALPACNLYGNQLTAIPDWTGQLTALTNLGLRGNQLTAVPDWIGQLTALTTLWLDNNRLTVVPDSIGQLTALTDALPPRQPADCGPGLNRAAHRPDQPRPRRQPASVQSADGSTETRALKPCWRSCGP